MVKFLQVVTLLFGGAGTVMGFYMLFFLQPGRDVGDDGSGFTITRPCLDSHGEPTC
jgi:hypothetical protein